MNDKKNISEEEWRGKLSEEQFHVLRLKGTEKPFTGKFLQNKLSGVYTCAACGNDLFDADSKFDSGSGWPSFNDVIQKGKVEVKTDLSHGMMREEIVCSKCGSHLGHVFNDGPIPTGLRYCVNSISLDFKEK